MLEGGLIKEPLIMKQSNQQINQITPKTAVIISEFLLDVVYT